MAYRYVFFFVSCFSGLIDLQFLLKLSKTYVPPPTPVNTMSSLSSIPKYEDRWLTAAFILDETPPVTCSGCRTTSSVAGNKNFLVGGRSERRVRRGDVGVVVCRVSETVFQPRS